MFFENPGRFSMKAGEKRSIDLRSDTVTLPSEEMLRSILTARLGDSLRDEDQTVLELESRAAKTFGMEMGLLLISGTMANQVAIAAHTRRGNVVLAPSVSHIARKEKVSTSMISGCAVAEVGGENGVLDPDEVARLVDRGKELFGSEVALVTAENTVNAPGGVIYPTSKLAELKEILEERGIPLHLDGSRVFNALVETGESPEEIGKACTTLTFCLSKGLGAPLGSVLLGPSDFIEKAKKWRNFLGGGMRQAGIIAAPGLFALENNVNRLKEDHEKARALADALSRTDEVEVLNHPVQTNMVIFRLKSFPVAEFQKELTRRGILLDYRRAPVIRAVTHLNVSFGDVETAAGEMVDILRRW